MKTIKKPGRNKKFGMRQENEAAFDAGSIRNSQSAIRNFPAFTLIELLVVISIIALLAAFTIPVLHTVARKKILDRTRGEMEQLATAIDRYKSAYGFYPPSNPNYNSANSATWDQAMISPLYFELLGTTNNNGTYYTLDGSATIGAGTANMTNAFGVSGFLNCSKTGAGEDAPAARVFLPDLKPNQFNSATNNSVLATVFVASVGGPDQSYMPFHGTPGFNPWRYVNPGINNPSSYDLWIQLVISGKTNLICNWSKNVQLNSPLP
jgi:prepilin-type N-terminal cleavage/methylation domain-containing protein